MNKVFARKSIKGVSVRLVKSVFYFLYPRLSFKKTPLLETIRLKSEWLNQGSRVCCIRIVPTISPDFMYSISQKQNTVLPESDAVTWK